MEAKPQPEDAFTLTVSRTVVHLSPFLKPSNKERGETGKSLKLHGLQNTLSIKPALLGRQKGEQADANPRNV